MKLIVKDLMYYIFCQEGKKNLEIGDVGNKILEGRKNEESFKKETVYS